MVFSWAGRYTNTFQEQDEEIANTIKVGPNKNMMQESISNIETTRNSSSRDTRMTGINSFFAYSFFGVHGDFTFNLIWEVLRAVNFHR